MFLLSFISLGNGSGWSPANECGCVEVHLSLVWGRVKSPSYWLLYLVSPSLPWGDLVMLWSAEVTSGDFSPVTQVSWRIEMLSERPVLKFCSCIILNWKHTWKVGYILRGQGVRKGRERRQATAMRQCCRWRRWQAAKDPLGCPELPHKYPLAWLSAQPHRGWLRAQLINRCFPSSSFL